MPSDPPFIDPSDRTLHTGQILYEAIPIASLIVLFGALALLPMLVGLLLAPGGFVGALFTVVAQFILAVGTGIVLLYLLVRANQLA